MASEESPLLGSEPPIYAPSFLDRDAVYKRFSPSRKRAILGMVAWCALMPLFISGTFIPSIPQIAKDLHSTGTVVSLAVSLSVFSASVGSLSSATYSTYYGRRPIYIVGLPLLFVGSLAVASARTIPQLMVGRVIQAFGSSAGFSVGAAVIGDIYKLEERGQAMGVFFAAVLVGPTLAPLAGGIAAHYASWRILQHALAIIAVPIFVGMVLFFPETSHPNARGIDKVPADESLRWRLKLINPLGPLWLLRSPNLLAVALSGTFVHIAEYVLLVPLAYTIGARYNITNEALIGACFLPAGIGNMIGAPVAGWASDKIIIRWRERRGGVWYPEDRLRATYLGGLVVLPLSVLCSGLLTQFVPGKMGLILNLVCLFFNGAGVDLVLAPSVAYVVDVMHARSAESYAANNSARSFLLSFAIAGILPLVNTVGVAATNTLAAVGSWIGFGLIILTIKYGKEMRGWVDVGFSTGDHN